MVTLLVLTTVELNKQIKEASIKTLKKLEDQVEMLKWGVKYAIWQREKSDLPHATLPYPKWLRDRESGFCPACQDRKEEGAK